MKRLNLKLPVWLQIKSLMLAGSLLVVPGLGHLVVDARATEPETEEAQVMTLASTAVALAAPAVPPAAPVTEIDGDAIWSIAHQLAESSQYLNAIAILQSIPAEHVQSEKAIAKISELEQSVMNHARSQYEAGNHKQAFTTLAMIPASSKVHTEAKNLLSQWVKEQHQKQFIREK